MEELDLSRSINFLSLVAIIGLYQGLFVGIYLLLKKSVKHHANRYLGGVVLVISSFFLTGVTYRVGLLLTFPHVVHVDYIFYFFYGPLAYFYVLSCSQKDFRLTPIMWLHFAPALLAFIYHLPFFMQSGEAKIMSFADFFLRGDNGLENWYNAIRFFHPLIYFVLCMRTISDYKKHLSDSTSNIDHAYDRWLSLFSVVLLIPIFMAVFVAFSRYNIMSITSISVVFYTFITSILIAILVKPSLFHRFPHQMEIPDEAEEKRKKYESSNLQEDRKERYVTKLLDFMKEEKPHLESDLTLAELSNKINIPTHHLSQIINEKLECNFLDFINQYRVKEVQEKLLAPESQNFTVLSIAYDAGFNSKSTFYAAFKKQTSMTPNQYKKQYRAVS